MAGFARKRLHSAEDYTVAIICPLEVEMSAMRYMLDEEHDRLPRVDGDQNTYVFGKVSGHNVVIGFLPHGSQGIGAAATVAVHMMRSFSSIQLRMLVGLAGGIPSRTNDIRLGDVVISMPFGIYGGVVQYDLGKETATGFERKGALEAPPKEWRDAVVLMASDHRVHGNRLVQNITNMLRQYPRLDIYRQPDPSGDMLFNSGSIHVLGESTCGQCEQTQLISRPSRLSNAPSVFLGLIASGDRVIKDGKVRDQISQEAGGALCFEMEAAGMMNDFQCVVIRGICDYADSHKNDQWHAYAAATAAACAKELLSYLELRPNVIVKCTRGRASRIEGSSYQDSTMQAQGHSNIFDTPKTMPVTSHTQKFFKVPNQHVKDFIGREDQLQAIANLFAPPVPERPRIVIIHALGGQGKSQLALECCHRYKNNYSGVYWINASTVSSIMQSVLGLVGQLDVSGLMKDATEDVKLSFVFRTLGTGKERWLLVYDNCDDPSTFELIRSVIPNDGTIDILVTSRHHGLEQLGTLIELPPLPTNAGVALLLGGYRWINVSDYIDLGARIVNRLGGLALAIKQAAAFIQHEELSIERLDDFISIYETHRKKILRHIPDELWEYGTFHNNLGNRMKAVNAFTTWEMSLRYLYSDRNELQEAVLHVLTLAAFLAPTSVSETIFRNYCESRGPKSRWMHLFLSQNGEDDTSSEEERKHELLGQNSALQRARETRDNHVWSHDKFRSFVNLTKKNSLTQGKQSGIRPGMVEFSLHPLVRDWLQLRGSRKFRLELITEAANMIVESIEIAKRQNLKADDKNALLPHIDAIMQFHQKHIEQDNRMGECLGTLDAAFVFARHYFEQGQYKNSQALLEKAYPVCIVKLGLEHKTTQKFADSMARTYTDSALHDKALAILKDLVDVRCRILGPTHSQTLKNKTDLCETLTYKAFYETGNYDEVELLLREILDLDFDILGADDHNRMEAMRILSLVNREQGQLEDAERMDRLIIESRQKTLGPEAGLTLSAKYNLILILDLKNEFEEAERLLRDLVEAEARVSGLRHIKYLNCVVLWASVLRSLNDHDKAESLLRKVLEDLENAVGRSHPVRSHALFVLALVLRDGEHYEEAVEIMTQALEAAFQTSGLQSRPARPRAEVLIRCMRSLRFSEESITDALEKLIAPLRVSEADTKIFLGEAFQLADEN